MKKEATLGNNKLGKESQTVTIGEVLHRDYERLKGKGTFNLILSFILLLLGLKVAESFG